MRLSVIASGIMLSAALFSSAAHAAIVVTQASVTHRFGGDPQFGSTSVPMSNASPGNHFDTFDGSVRAKLDINQTSGSLLLFPRVWRNDIIGYSQMNLEGTIRFTAIDGDFSLGYGAASSGNTSGLFELTRLDNGQTRRIQFAQNFYTNNGTLSFPATAGEYELTFSSGSFATAGSLIPGYVTLAFAITPEPTSLAAMLGAGLFVRRRRV